MIMRLAMFTLMVLGLVGFGAVAWVSAYPPKTAAAAHAPVARDETVIVLAHDVHAGTLLKAEDLAAHPIAAAAVPPGAIEDGAEARHNLAGSMVRRSLSTGDAILPGDVMRPGDHGFLAAVLRPGMRATTIGVDAVSGAAGLIWPGDRVDVIMTQMFDDPSVPMGRRISAEAVLHDTRVIAIDQELVQGASPGTTDAQTARTVTLEVTEDQAERLQVAARIGRLSVTVRAADAGPASAHSATAEPQAPIFADDVSHALAMPYAQAAPPDLLRVYPGAGDSKEFHF